MSNNCKLRFKAGEGHWSEDENWNKSNLLTIEICLTQNLKGVKYENAFFDK